MSHCYSSVTLISSYNTYPFFLSIEKLCNTKPVALLGEDLFFYYITYNRYFGNTPAYGLTFSPASIFLTGL